jgi:hypothetical protein
VKFRTPYIASFSCRQRIHNMQAWQAVSLLLPIGLGCSNTGTPLFLTRRRGATEILLSALKAQNRPPEPKLRALVPSCETTPLRSVFINLANSDTTPLNTRYDCPLVRI